MRVLISWLAYHNDFQTGEDDPGELVRRDGPTYEFHRHFFADYDRHLILSGSEPPDFRLEALVNRLRLDFPARDICGEHLTLRSPIDLREILTRVETFLLDLDADEIDIFISPGTPAMQTAWYLHHVGLGLPTRLLQTVAQGDGGRTQPELIQVQIERDHFPATTILSQHASRMPGGRNFLMTPAIHPVYERASKAAQTDRVTVLIHGETGTGKEHLARYLHDQSIRANRGSFVPVNCSAMQDQLLESRLFGYRKGAFTGADSDQKGIFETARGGTVFLDEIGDISPYMQQALLRVLQEQQITRIGETHPREIDVRIIAATHQDLPALCEAGDFRWDLYFRLAIVELQLPPLLERGTDEIKQLLEHFIQQEFHHLRRQQVLRLSPEARDALLAYPWPGNVRELQHVVRRLYVFAEGEVQLADLPERILQPHGRYSLHWQDVEAAHIRKVLRLKQGNQAQALKALGYGSINTLRKKINEYGIDPDQYRSED